MNRILQAIGAAVVAAMPHAALALDADLTLDRFPSGGQTAVSGTSEWRGDGSRDGWKAVRDHRGGAYSDRHDSFHHHRDEAFRPEWRDAGRYRSSGSMIDVRTFGGAVERGSFYGTAGTGTGGSSIIVIGLPDAPGAIAPITNGGLRGGAKILDVEADRLDRRPYGRDGLAVAYNGTSKIIRIAPDFRRGTAQEPEQAADGSETPFAELPPEERAVTVYPDTDMGERPVDPPARRVAQTAPVLAAPAPAAPTPAPAPEPAGFLEPWTPDWLRDCVARHPDFDASLGTYTGADGQRRFCTGEP